MTKNVRFTAKVNNDEWDIELWLWDNELTAKASKRPGVKSKAEFINIAIPNGWQVLKQLFSEVMGLKNMKGENYGSRQTAFR